MCVQTTGKKKKATGSNSCPMEAGDMILQTDAQTSFKWNS